MISGVKGFTIADIGSGAAEVVVAREKGEELFNDWGGRGYDDYVPGKVTKTAPSGDRTT